MIQSYPKTTVISGAKFGIGKLNIVAIINNIEILKTNPQQKFNLPIGIKLAEASDNLVVVAKPHLTIPRAKSQQSDRAPQFVPDVFMVSYWAIGTTNDRRLSNVVKSSKVVSTKLFGETYDIIVPSYTNERVIEVGDELLIAKELPTR